MKKSIKLLCLAFIALTSIGITACSKDDNSPITIAEGTFEGEMTAYNIPGKPIEVYNKTTITIKKTGEGKLLVTPHPSTGATPRSFNVFNEDGDIVNKDDDPDGVFIYYSDENSVQASAFKIPGNTKDPYFRFKGFRKK